MEDGGPRENRPWQFTLRTALLAMLVIALAFAWYNSIVGMRQRIEQLQRRLWSAQSEIRNAESRARFAEAPKGKMSGKGGLSSVCLDGVNLRDVSIRGQFQIASFRNSDLRGATLIGGGASFQGSHFDGANLKNATLTGGAGSSFQFASFVKADLSGAVVTGNLQCASFAGARLIGTQVVAPSCVAFQAVNIDGTQFQGADLSTIAPDSLESCYFNTPPVYDDKTRFPTGFDPAKQGWDRVE